MRDFTETHWVVFTIYVYRTIRRKSLGELNLSLEEQFEYYREKQNQRLEVPGIEPGASYMQSMRSTTELHPLAGYLLANTFLEINFISWGSGFLSVLTIAFNAKFYAGDPQKPKKDIDTLAYRSCARDQPGARQKIGTYQISSRSFHRGLKTWLGLLLRLTRNQIKSRYLALRFPPNMS